MKSDTVNNLYIVAAALLFCLGVVKFGKHSDMEQASRAQAENQAWIDAQLAATNVVATVHHTGGNLQQQ